MAVGVERQHDRGVTEPLLNHLGVDARAQEERCVRVPQIVEPEMREPGPLQQWVEPATDQIAFPDWVPT